MSKATMDILRQCTPIFATLQDEGRQEILLHLFDNRELTVNALAEKMTLSRPAVSHHLKILLSVGVVAVRKEGKERYYRVSLDDSINLLRSLVASIEADKKTLEQSD